MVLSFTIFREGFMNVNPSLVRLYRPRHGYSQTFFRPGHL